MTDMKLSREQIKKFVDIYEHFHEIQHFTVQCLEDGKISITFNLDDVELIKDQTNEHYAKYTKEFVLDSKLN